MTPAAQPAWMLSLKAGDVLTRNGRTLRVVRWVTRKADGRLATVTFTIQRGSWTGRPDTCYTASDLKTLRYRPVGVRIPLTSDIDRRFRDYLIRFPDRAEGYGIAPADVRGVA